MASPADKDPIRLLGTLGSLINWPVPRDREPSLALSQLTDAIVSALAKEFASRHVTPLKQSDSAILFEYELPLPGDQGLRCFRFDMDFLVHDLTQDSTSSWLVVQPRIFAEVVRRKGVVFQEQDGGDLTQLFSEIRKVLEGVAPGDSKDAPVFSADLPVVLAECNQPLPLPSPADLPGSLAQVTDRTIAALTARLAGSGAQIIRQPPYGIRIHDAMPVGDRPGTRVLSIDIELQIGAQGIVPRIFAESVWQKSVAGRMFNFLDQGGDALRALANEIADALKAP